MLKNDMEINIILFSMKGHEFAMDIESVSAMLPLESVEKDDPELIWFHEKIDLNSAGMVYLFPRVLCMSQAGKKIYLVVDNVRDMPLCIGLGDILPLPFLVEKYVRSKFIWGVCLLQERMVLLVDAWGLIDKMKVIS